MAVYDMWASVERKLGGNKLGLHGEDWTVDGRMHCKAFWAWVSMYLLRLLWVS
jgi:hypothetical protein